MLEDRPMSHLHKFLEGKAMTIHTEKEPPRPDLIENQCGQEVIQIRVDSSAMKEGPTKGVSSRMCARFTLLLMQWRWGHF